MSNIKEAIRQINIELSKSDVKKQIITFFSQDDLVMQQTIIANMAIMYGYAGENVLIVDTDFTSNVFLESFGLNKKAGLEEYLENQIIDFTQVLSKVPNENVSILNSGIESGKAANFLLSDPKYNSLIQSLSKQYDRILINTTKFSAIDSLANILNNSDGEILFVDSQISKRKMYKMIKKLEQDRANILGYVNIEKE